MRRALPALLVVSACAGGGDRAPPAHVASAAVATTAATRRPDEPRMPPWGPRERFRVRLEQGGQEIAVVAHHASLAAGPYDVVLTLRREAGPTPFAIAIHVALTDDAVVALAHGEPLPDTAFARGSGMTEERFDADHAFFASPAGHHEIYWRAPDDHRCSSAVVTTIDAPDDTLVCRRHVERILRAGSGEALDPKHYHLVFARLARGGPHVVEEQRDWITLDAR